MTATVASLLKESISGHFAPAYGLLGPAHLEAARAVSVLDALTSTVPQRSEMTAPWGPARPSSGVISRLTLAERERPSRYICEHCAPIPMSAEAALERTCLGLSSFFLRRTTKGLTRKRDFER